MYYDLVKTTEALRGPGLIPTTRRGTSEVMTAMSQSDTTR
jgi:hypothetical protein